MIFVRMAVMYFSANNYVFPIVVACYLMLMAIGNQISGHLLERNAEPRKLFAWTAAAALVSIIFSLALPSIVTSSGISLESFNFSQARYVNEGMLGVVENAIIISLLMMLPVAAVSAMFPIFVHTLTQDRALLGNNVGTVYFVQTIGNVVGATVAGFILLPLIGTVVTVQLGAVAITVCALAFSWKRTNSRASSAVSATAVLTFVMSPVAVYSNFSFNGNHPTRFSEEVDGVAFKYDHPGGTSINIGAERSTSFESTDKFQTLLEDTVSLYEAITQHEIKRVLIIGICTGTLAVQLQRYPHAEIVIVELLDVVIREMKERGSPSLRELIDRSPVFITDGRRYVERNAMPKGEKFDLIQIGVFHVTSSGAGGLFTKEFQTDLRLILTPEGAIAFNAYLPAVRTAFDIFKKGLIFSRELGRQVTDALFFNDDGVDLIAGLHRYPSTVRGNSRNLLSTDKIETIIPRWYLPQTTHASSLYATKQ